MRGKSVVEIVPFASVCERECVVVVGGALRKGVGNDEIFFPVRNETIKSADRCGTREFWSLGRKINRLKCLLVPIQAMRFQCWQ